MLSSFQSPAGSQITWLLSQKHNLDRHGSECPTFQKQMHMRTPPLCSSASHSPRCTVSSVALISSKEQSGNTPEQHSAQWFFRSWFHTRKLRLDINRKALLKVLGLTRDTVGEHSAFPKPDPSHFHSIVKGYSLPQKYPS